MDGAASQLCSDKSLDKLNAERRYNNQAYFNLNKKSCQLVPVALLIKMPISKLIKLKLGKVHFLTYKLIT